MRTETLTAVILETPDIEGEKRAKKAAEELIEKAMTEHAEKPVELQQDGVISSPLRLILRISFSAPTHIILCKSKYRLSGISI